MARNHGNSFLGNPLTRILQNIRIGYESGCWVWDGGLSSKGYAQIVIAGKRKMAHRVAYEETIGPIPDGMMLDHLCRNRACCNPKHLEPVTNTENQKRGLKGTLKTHCARGHAYVEGNIYRHKSNGRIRSRCLTCTRAKYGRK